MKNKWKNTFDAYSYFEDLHKKNKLLQEYGFSFNRVSGIRGLEEVVSKMKFNRAFLAIDDTNDGAIAQYGGGYFRHRVFTVFLFRKARAGNMDDYAETKDICRKIQNQICSRMIQDSQELENNLIYMNTSKLQFKEIERYMLDGAYGLYFMFDVKEPQDLKYNKDEWVNS